MLALTFAPAALKFQNQKVSSGVSKGFKINSGEGRIHGHLKLNIHPLQDEVFYVIEGEYYFKVGTDKHRLGVGDSIFLPRNVPHAWTQVSEKGKMTIIFQPAGKMEEFFVTMAGLKNEPTAEENSKIFTENEMQIVGPPLKIE